MSGLLAPPRALERVLERVRPLADELVPIEEALGRTVAADVASSDRVPSFDNSAMDGFAVRAADTIDASADAPVTLRVAGESRAGRPASVTLRSGDAVRISTGAMLPDGADAVVRIEDCLEKGDAVVVRVPAAPGKEVRRAGEDIREGEVVLSRGTGIGAAELGVLASVGVGQVRCARRPRVSVLTTGDELVEPGGTLGPGQIRNSSAYAVPAQARAAGAVVTNVAVVPDDYRATVAAIGRALGTDALVICGGVSVGAHDHVKGALAELGVEEVFWGVALRPGRPTWFGVRESVGDAPPGPTLVFGLPGNPVSAMVTFHLFVRPALARMTGAALERRATTAVMDVGYRKRPGRAHVVRCRLEAREDGWHVRPTKEQGSHILTSMLGAQALALIEIERGDVSAGERVEIEIL